MSFLKYLEIHSITQVGGEGGGVLFLSSSQDFLNYNKYPLEFYQRNLGLYIALQFSASYNNFPHIFAQISSLQILVFAHIFADWTFMQIMLFSKSCSFYFLANFYFCTYFCSLYFLVSSDFCTPLCKFHFFVNSAFAHIMQI